MVLNEGVLAVSYHLKVAILLSWQVESEDWNLTICAN